MSHPRRSPIASTATPAEPTRVVTIGNTTRGEFRSVTEFIANPGKYRLERAFQTIGEALVGGFGTSLRPDLILVFQSWPDEHSPIEIDRLIGLTISSRLLCCYGDWCESTGRTRGVWPIAHCIPARIAASVIHAESLLHTRRTAGIPPTASPEEVFAARIQHTSGCRDWTSDSNPTAIVVSDDRFVRQTVAAGCRAVGFEPISIRPLGETFPSHLKRTSPRFVIHDLDDQVAVLGRSLTVLRQSFPEVKILGLTAAPDTHALRSWIDFDVRALIPRFDLVHGLMWHLRCREFDNC